MPYAAENKISTGPIEGGIEITQAQYSAALAGLQAGKLVSIDGGFAVVDKPEPSEPQPEPEPEPTLEEKRAGMQLSFAQLLIGLVTEAWITEAEGEAWLAGQLPAAVEALIASLPSQQRFAAKARAARPSIILRTDKLVIDMATAQGKEPEELDTFFTTYAAV